MAKTLRLPQRPPRGCLRSRKNQVLWSYENQVSAICPKSAELVEAEKYALALRTRNMTKPARAIGSQKLKNVYRKPNNAF
ncbi:MAG: hypothetical protein ACUVQM_01705 [Candidatus Hadarchaeaceae archaeon]